MRTVSYRLSDLGRAIIPIGKVAENEATQVRIDSSEVFADYPTAVPSLSVLNPSGESYPVSVSTDGVFVLWNVKDSDLTAEGDGEFQLSFSVNTTVVKSSIGHTHVCRSIVADGEAPDPVQDWMTEANSALAEIENISASATSLPAGSEPTATYTDGALAFGIPQGERGQAGQDGAPGQDGQNGADGVSPSVDVEAITGGHRVTITDAEGDHTFDVMDGETGTAIIDDTSTAADKVWSASKTNDLKSALSVLEPTASASDVGKALIVKTIADGKATSYEYGEAGGGSVDPSAIAQAVDDWCDENITNPDSPPLDRSLTSSSAAAPADLMGSIKTALVTEKLSVNMCNPSDIAYNRLNLSNGDVDSGTGSYKHSGFIQVDYNTQYVFSNAEESYKYMRVCFYSTNSTSGFVSSSDQSYDNIISVPNNSSIAYMRFSLLAATTKWQLQPGTTPTEYEEYGSALYSIKYDGLADIVDETLSETDKLAPAKVVGDKIAEFGVTNEKNLIDEDALIENVLINDSGAEGTSNDNKATDFIKIDPSTEYTFSNAEDYYSTVRIAFYTSNSGSSYISGSYISPLQMMTFKTPATANYLRMSCYKTTTKWQLEKGIYATDYREYHSTGVNAAVLVEEPIKVALPCRLYALKNQEMNVYFDNILNGSYEDYDIICNMGSGHQFKRCFRLNSSNAEEKTFEFTVRKGTSSLHKRMPWSVVNASDLTATSILVMGDSTTAGGDVIQKLHDNINNESLITTLGTCGTAPYNHEGHSGWSTGDFLTKTDAQGNPFYNPSTEKFDASYYFSHNNIQYPDYFIINLGINDMFNLTKDKVPEVIENIDTIIDSVQSASNTIKICVALTIPPNSSQDAFGNDYAGRAEYALLTYKDRWFNFVRALIDTYDNRESEGIFVIPINVNLDTVYGMGHAAKAVNARSQETEVLPTDGSAVHPNTSGYWQIADVYWAFLCYRSSLET